MTQVNAAAVNENEEGHTPAFIIPTDPKVLRQLKDGLAQIEASKVRASGEKTYQTESIKKLVEDTGIPNSVIRKLAKVQNDGGVHELIQEVGDLEALFVAMNNPNVGGVPADVVLTASEDAVQAAIVVAVDTTQFTTTLDSESESDKDVSAQEAYEAIEKAVQQFDAIP